MATRLFYVDDSGAERTGYAVFGFVEVAVTDWADALDSWLHWRTVLHNSTGIPKREELHLTDFANGRGNPSGSDDWDRVKKNRWDVVDDCATHLANIDQLSYGAVFSHTQARGRDFTKERDRVYSALVQRLDAYLTNLGDRGIVVMDGSVTEGYVRAHRDLNLGSRAIIEDPSFHDSRRNQWVQIADIVAYSAYQNVLGEPRNRFAWDWYTTMTRGSTPTLV